MSGHDRFTSLGSITKKDFRVNVFAVVKFFRKPIQTKGSDKSFFFTLVDPTLYENEESLKCIFFANNEEHFPIITNVGDVVKFTSLGVTIYNDQLQGRNKNGSSWVTFDGRPNAPVVPRFSQNSSRNVTDMDKKKVEQLKKWAATVGFLSLQGTSRRSLAQLTNDNLYFDLLCQVVALSKRNASNKSVVLHVWDGTVPALSGLKSQPDDCLSSATKWGAKVVGKCNKVHVFRSDSELPVNPGDYVQITNLHLTFREDAGEGKDGKEYELKETKKVPFLTLHEGNSFGRALRVLHEDDPDIKELVNQMEASITTSVSTTGTSVPTTETSVPIAMTSVPITKTSIPITKTSIPMTKTSVPITKTSVPITKTSIPTTESSVPTTVTFVPRTDTLTLIGQSAGFMQHHSNSRAVVSTTLSRPIMPGHNQFRSLGSITRQDYRVNVFAVVKFFRKPTQTKGSDKSFFFTIVDPTLYENEESLKCIFFEKNEENFPVISNIGDVVKFTSLSITVYRDKIQGINRNGFSWTTFDGHPNALVVPRFLPNSPRNFTDMDKAKVEELKTWAASVDFLSLTTSRRSLAKLTNNNLYFNLLCQVVAVDKRDASNKSIVLHVWDGTVPALSGLKSEHDVSFSSATKWGAKVVGMCNEVHVFHEDIVNDLPVNPGDYVQITNLHLTFKEDIEGETNRQEITKQENARQEYAEQETAHGDAMEIGAGAVTGEEAERRSIIGEANRAKKVPSLILHEGSTYGRGLRVLQEDDPDIKQLVARMEALPTTSLLRTEILASNVHTGVIQRPSSSGDISERVHFTRLRKISTKDFSVNLFAVVKSFRKPTRTKGRDKSFCFSLVDSSLHKDEACLKCVFFEKNGEKMPVINNIGDVVKFTSLGITVFKGQIQGRNKDGFSWITFDGRSHAPVVPRFSPNYRTEFTERDERIVKLLKTWATSIDFLSRATSRRSLAELTGDDSYFDLMCQIVAVGERDATKKSVVLHVWDGTLPALSSVKSEHDDSFSSATKWGEKVVGKCVDINVFHKDREPVVSCGPEDYIQLTNVRFISKERAVAEEAVTGKAVVEEDDTGEPMVEEAATEKEVVKESNTGEPMAEDAARQDADPLQKALCLVLVDGRKTTPGIRILRQNIPDVMTLIDRIESLPTSSIPGIENLTLDCQSRIVRHPSNSNYSVSVNGKAKQLSGEELCGKPNEVLSTGTPKEGLPMLSVSRTEAQMETFQLGMFKRPSNPAALAFGKGQARNEEPIEERPVEREVVRKWNAKERSFTEIAAGQAMEIGSTEAIEQLPLNSVSASENHEAEIELPKKRKASKEPNGERVDDARVKFSSSPELTIPGKELIAPLTSTVAHPARRRIQRWTIAQALDHPIVPSTFLCRAKVWRYWPEASSQYVKYACQPCRKVFSSGEFPDASNARVCPNANCGKPLSFTLFVTLVLTDDNAFLDVGLFDKVARELFPDIDPAALLTDQAIQRSVDERMRRLRDGNISLDFVVKTYYGPKDKDGAQVVMYRVAKTRFMTHSD